LMVARVPGLGLEADTSDRQYILLLRVVDL